jgi:hypothetical protein
MMGTLYLLFNVNALANRLVRAEPVTAGDIQQATTNNIALYFSALIVFGFGEFGNHLAAITGWVFIFMLCLMIISYFFFPSDVVLQRSLSVQSVILLAMFIGFNWNGLIVTLLWVALAVVLFVLGIYNRRSWPRLGAILLMTITLGKLIIFDTSKFTTLQKIVAYLVIGTLLLILSFYYQKFKQTLFKDTD